MISIHAPHTGRDGVLGVSGLVVAISIHAPHTGRDYLYDGTHPNAAGFQSTRPIRGATFCVSLQKTEIQAFQSTRPIRGATSRCQRFGTGCQISIHAPHTGRDLGCTTMPMGPNRFQSTRPIRGATIVKIAKYYTKFISIHAPHTGRDSFLLRGTDR